MRLSSAAPVCTVPAGANVQRLSLKAEIERLILRRDGRQRTHANQEPGAPFLAASAREVGIACGQLLTDHHRFNCRTRSKSVPATTIGCPSPVRATISPNGAAIPRPARTESTCASASAGREAPSLPDQNDIRPVVAKLAPQLRLHIHIKIQHRSRHRRRHHHREQRRSRAPRRNTAARNSMRRNIEVCGACARLAARSRAECDIDALTVHLAARTPDPDSLPAESPPRSPQTSRSPQSPESPATAPAESKSPN